jgi:hypothetical protein
MHITIAGIDFDYRDYDERSDVLYLHVGCRWEALGALWRVSDGTRTRDRLDHNQELYQLSYAHHGSSRV